MDSMEKSVRGAALRTLRDVSAQSGYANAIKAARTSVELLGRVDESAVEVMAHAMADGRDAIAYDQEVGLDDYDVAFELAEEVI